MGQIILYVDSFLYFCTEIVAFNPKSLEIVCDEQPLSYLI